MQIDDKQNQKLERFVAKAKKKGQVKIDILVEGSNSLVKPNNFCFEILHSGAINYKRVIRLEYKNKSLKFAYEKHVEPHLFPNSYELNIQELEKENLKTALDFAKKIKKEYLGVTIVHKPYPNEFSVLSFNELKEEIKDYTHDISKMKRAYKKREQEPDYLDSILDAFKGKGVNPEEVFVSYISHPQYFISKIDDSRIREAKKKVGYVGGGPTF